MGILTKWLSRNFCVARGISGVAFCLSVLFLNGSVLGQQVSSQVAPKPQRWTILCERDDGTQGVFRVTSKVTNEVSSPLGPAKSAETGEATPESPSPEIEDETSANPGEDDPFGNPTLKCGRLLTLLAFFGTAESPAH